MATAATARAAAVASMATAEAVAAAPAATVRRGQQAAEEVRRRAARLGLTGPLGVDCGVGVEGGGGAFAAELLDAVSERAALAWDLPRLGTALTWFDAFLQATRRVPFIPAVGAGAVGGYLWNRATLDMFAEFVRRSPPLGNARGSSVSADAVASYVSAIHLLRSREARYDICPAEANLVLPLAARQMRRQDGPPGDRRLCRALRLEHLQLAEQEFDRSTARGCVEWAAVLTAHSALLRGGEVGVPDGAEIDLRRVITWSSIRWQQPRRESGGRPWLILMVVPIKDKEGRRGAYPTPIARRHDGAFGADPLCAYDAIALAWWRRRAGSAPFPLDERGRPVVDWWQRATLARDAPADGVAFFTNGLGAPMCTSDVRALAWRVAAAAGIAAGDVGAKSFRIGGATDWRDCLGEASERVVRQRGRWCSDVALVYQRPLLASHLAASMRIRAGGSADLESVCAGFAQPGR